MKIGELSKQSGFSIATLRFYEENKNLPIAKRTSSGYREYEEKHLKTLLFVQECKSLGFSLSEILEFLSLNTLTSKNCIDIKTQIQLKKEKIFQKIRTLENIQKSLEQAEKQCNLSIQDRCYFLELLE